MLTQTTKILSLAILLALMSSCKTPEIRQVEKISTDNELFSDIQFSLDNQFEKYQITCIAVDKLDVIEKSNDYSSLKDSNLVRQTLIGNLVSRNYNTVGLDDFEQLKSAGLSNEEILEKSKCDAVMSGKVTAFRNDSLVTFSATIVGLDLLLQTSDGTTVWSGKHTASSKDGAIPFSPFALISGFLASQYNSENEIALQMVDAVSRRLIDTLPAIQKPQKNWEQLQTAINQISDATVEKVSASNLSSSSEASQLLAMGRIQKALEQARKAISEKKNLYENQMVGAKAATILGNQNLSVDFYLQALATEETIEAYSGLAFTYLKIGNTQLAKAAMQKAIGIEPTNANLRYQNALLLEAAADPNEAAKSYFKSGELAFREGDKKGVYRGLIALKRLSNYSSSNEYMAKLIDRAKSMISK